MTDWISIEKKYPDNFIKVLVYFEKPIRNGRHIEISCCYDGHWAYVLPGMQRPTYWMPLPEPPKEVANEVT